MKIKHYIFIYFSLSISGCIKIPESCFRLAPDSRIPKWFEEQNKYPRNDIDIKMCYYIDKNGRTAEFTIKNSKTGEVNKKLGALEGLHPISINNNTSNEGASFEVVSVNSIVEVIEHRQKNNIFYVSDDPSIRTKLEIQNK